MTRRDWWLGVSAICLVILFHAIFPRYELQAGSQSSVSGPYILRLDRWTGAVQEPQVGRGWVSIP